MPPDRAESPLFLSVIIPAYNEEKRLPRTLSQVTGYLAQQDYSSEVVVVDDGSEDNTTGVVEEYAASNPGVRLIRARHGGKGHAVRAGMLDSGAEYAFLCDADLAMPITELAKFLPPQREGYHVAIGSREGEGAVRYDESALRHFRGRVFNWIVKVMAVPGFEDTQCGFKCFHVSARRELFTRQTIDGFSFDVEILYIARKLGHSVVEVPIHWYHQSESKVHPVKDTLRMFRDLVKVRLNDMRGLY